MALKDRIELRNWDRPLLGATLGLMIAGLFCLYSATARDGSWWNPFNKQILWILLGWGAIIGMMFIPTRFFYRGAYLWYGISVILLAAVFAWGRDGVNRWIGFGGIQFQPSEFAKVATILLMARILSEERGRRFNWKRGLLAGMAVLPPMVLIAREPDMTTALIFIPMALIMLLWAGMPFRWLVWIIGPVLAFFSGFVPVLLALLILILITVLALKRTRWIVIILLAGLCLTAGLLAPSIWSQMEPYQQQRVMIFLGMRSDPHGAAYQMIQSKVAIGSGGIIGKGFLKGSQTQLRFLPEQHTDFIFSVLGEEFGFIGVALVMTGLVVLLMRMVYIAWTTRDRFAGLAVLGGASVIAVQAVINIAMTVGLAPVTGLPLPFMTYGGSSIISSSLMVGLAANGAVNKFDY